MAAVPASAMPAPVTAAPTPMTVVAVPVHLLRLQLRGLFAAGDCGMSVGIALRHAAITERLRRQWRSIRGGRERGSSGRDTDCKFQKIPALHDFFLLDGRARDAEEVSR